MPWGPSPAGPTIRTQEISEFFCDNLPAGSPYHVVQGGKAESVQKLTAEDLRAYHAKYFVPNNMVVTVFGDIDPDEALALVKKLFGGLKPAPDFQPISFDRPNAIAKTIVRHKTIGKPTAMVMFGYPTASIFDKEDYAAMTVLGAVMAGYQLSGRMAAQRTARRGAGVLRPRLPDDRARAGLFRRSSPRPGPTRSTRSSRGSSSNVERAKEGQISEDEFRTAVQTGDRPARPGEHHHRPSRPSRRPSTSCTAWATTITRRSTRGSRRSSSKDVVAAARKYFGNHVLVTSSPENETADVGELCETASGCIDGRTRRPRGRDP